jgi:hypothetical protein
MDKLDAHFIHIGLDIAHDLGKLVCSSEVSVKGGMTCPSCELMAQVQALFFVGAYNTG